MAVGLHRQKRVLAVTHASAGGNAKEPEDTTSKLLVEIGPHSLFPNSQHFYCRNEVSFGTGQKQFRKAFKLKA
jgi:hypothetical protein